MRATCGVSVLCVCVRGFSFPSHTIFERKKTLYRKYVWESFDVF
jgi:hypothetical protein